MGFIIRGLGTVEPNGGAVLPLPWRERIAGAIRRARSLSFWPPHPAVALAPPAFRQRRAEAVYFIRRNGTGFGSGMWGCHALWSFTNRSLTVSTGNYDYNRTTNCGVRSDLWPPMWEGPARVNTVHLETRYSQVFGHVGIPWFCEDQ